MAKEAGGIVKEGLSEYFIFTLPSTATIRNGWSQRIRAVEASELEFDIVYRMRSYQYGERPVRFFVWKNDQEHKLGDSPLPDGMVRVFRENGQGGLGVLGSQQLNYVPIRAAVELNLGPDDLVAYQQVSRGVTRGEFQFHPNNSRRHCMKWARSFVQSNALKLRVCILLLC